MKCLSFLSCFSDRDKRDPSPDTNELLGPYTRELIGVSRQGLYLHQPLRPNSIRLIKLRAAQNAHDELECTLVGVTPSHRSTPKYVALSYCWEAQVPDTPIRCGGGRLDVTRNCVAALKALREPHETLYVWVDSVCIDQANVVERNDQVARMGEIYKGAERVCVWLGEWDAPLRNAVCIIKDLGYDIYGMMLQREDSESLQAESKAKAEILNKAYTTPEKDPIEPLFSRPWFSRIWPVQETGLSLPHNVTIYGGKGSDLCLKWWVLLTAVDTLQSCGYRSASMDKAMKLQKHLSLKMGAVSLVRQPLAIAKTTDPRLAHLAEQILAFSREKEATDARDKIFALYSVFQDMEVQMPRPDYNKSVEDVFREATIACIEADRSLDVLYDAASDFRHYRPALSSWAPDWTDPGWGINLTFDVRAARFRNSLHASASASASWRFSPDGRILNLSGKVFGSVTDCGQPLQISDDFYNNIFNIPPAPNVNPKPSAASLGDVVDLKTLRHQFSEACLVLKSWVTLSKRMPCRATSEPLWQTFCRTVFEGYQINTHKFSQQELSNYYNSISRSELEVMEEYVHDNPDSFADQPRYLSRDEWLRILLPVVDRLDLAPFYVPKDLDHLHVSATLMSNKQTFFITDDGHMGIAPAVRKNGVLEKLIMPGDRIATIAGLSMPFILRSVDTENGKGLFRLVTHTYIDGMMHGERWGDETIAVEEIGLI